MNNNNFFATLRAAFPDTLDAVAVETDQGLAYSWRDLERATAMMANLLESLKLPAGARVAAQLEESVEAVMLYWATLRAGCVFLPLNTACQSLEIAHLLGHAQPAVVVCNRQKFGWISKTAFKAGTQNVFTLNPDRTGSLLERAAHCSDQHTLAVKQTDDLAAVLYTCGTTDCSKSTTVSHGDMPSYAQQVLKDHWGWQSPEKNGADKYMYLYGLVHST